MATGNEESHFWHVEFEISVKQLIWDIEDIVDHVDLKPEPRVEDR